MSSISTFTQADFDMLKANPGFRFIQHPDGTKSLSYHAPEPFRQEPELLDLVNDRQPAMGGSVGSPLPLWHETHGVGGHSSTFLEPLPAADMAQVSEPAAGGGEATKPKHKPAGKRVPCPEFNDLSNEEKQTWLRREVRDAIDVPYEGLEYLLTLDNKGRRKSPRNIFLNSLGMTRLETINLQQCIVQYGRKKAELVLKEVKELVNK